MKVSKAAKIWIDYHRTPFIFTHRKNCVGGKGILCKIASLMS
jgi:hypothetical protein